MTKSNGDSWRFYRTWQFPAALLLLLFFYYCSANTPRQDPPKRKITQNLLAEIEAGVDFFKIDHGAYPIHTGASKDGAAALVKSLIPPENSGEYIYLDNPPSRKLVNTIGGVETLVDLWGDPIHYRCEPPSTPVHEKSTRNPTYDLWSTGGDPDNPPDRWITNWGI